MNGGKTGTIVGLLLWSISSCLLVQVRLVLGVTPFLFPSSLLPLLLHSEYLAFDKVPSNDHALDECPLSLSRRMAFVIPQAGSMVEQ